MIKVCFISDWASPSQLLNVYKRQTPNNSGIWGNITGVTDIDSSDVIINMGNHVVQNYNKSKHLIQMRREPDVIQKFYRSVNTNHHYMDYSDNSKYMTSIWQFITIDFDNIISMSYWNKPKIMSAITSDKHHHRNLFFNKLKTLNLDIDIFGKNYQYIHPEIKDEGLKDYKFSIAIENSSQMNYFSEKINDCYLYWTFPIYWGCPNISDFFPENSYRLLDLNKPENISQIINEPISKKELESMKEARNLVIYKYNIWPTIENILT